MYSSLFDGTSVHSLFNGHQKDIRQKVDRMTPEQLHREMTVIVAEFEQAYFVEIPALVEDGAYADDPPDDPNSDQFRITLHLPFTGDKAGFSLEASNRPIVMDHCSVNDGRLSFQMMISKHRPEELLSKQKALYDQIAGGLDTLRDEFGRRMKQVPNWVHAAVNERRQKVANDGKARSNLAGLFPIKKREEAAKIVTPEKRQPLQVSSPKPSSPTQPPNHALEMAAYDDILRTIEAMVHVFERSPGTFRKMEEEDLRMILLVALNGLYEGKATGETFNGEGKTDILIRQQDQNLFIAECLVWKGQGVLQSKMDDQLFKYATWRDSKLAILIFNRNKGFSEVVTKMKETVEAHPQKIKTLPYQHASGARYLFRRADDPQKEFTLTCLAFDVP